MESSMKEYVVRNSLAYAYDALRSKERFIGDTTNSYYEEYFQQLLERLGPPGKRWDLSVNNSEVEAFYLGRVSLGEFRLKTQERVFSKIPGWECAPLFTFIWSECCSVADKVALCAKVDAGIGRQIWEIFIHLDVDSQGKVHVDDLCDLTLRILRENGHVELEQNIKEWFCEEILIDFWSFFAAVVENYSGLLKPKIIRSLHELITTEVLLSGKLTKKGHKIHSWKDRWFSLQHTQLTYFESQENMVVKGTIAIGVSTQFDLLPDSKGHQRRFRVTDAQTQVPYEICTPDSESLQRWTYGIQLAKAMNSGSGTNFLHRLTLAQKEVFPQNTAFSVSAVAPCSVATPTSPASHSSLAPVQSVPLEKTGPRPPSPYNKSKSGSELLKATSNLASRGPEESSDAPLPPVSQQRYMDGPSVVRRQKPPRGPATRDALEEKAKRRHSSITYSSEYEKEQEREREKERMEQVSTMYAVVTKPKKNSQPNSPDRPISPPALPAKSLPPEREVRRICPKTPSPSAERCGYIQLEFQNGTSNLHKQNSTPTPATRSLPPAVRAKWDYSTVVFDKEAAKAREKEFEENGGEETTKKNKPLPPPPGSKNTASDSILVTAQPIPRPRKLPPFSDSNGPQRGPRSVDNDSSSLTTPTQNGNVRRELPKLPPKETGERKRELPALPPKDNKPRGESPTQSKPLPRPRPTPRQSTTSPIDAPPPIPARRSPMET